MRRSVDLTCMVRSSLWSGPVDLVARDLSPDGIYLATDFPLDIGEEVSMTFEMESNPLRIKGAVTRVALFRRDIDRGVSGMGIRFDPMDPSVETQLRKALVGRPPPLPGPRAPQARARSIRSALFRVERRSKKRDPNARKSEWVDAHIRREVPCPGGIVIEVGMKRVPLETVETSTGNIVSVSGAGRAQVVPNVLS